MVVRSRVAVLVVVALLSMSLVATPSAASSQFDPGGNDGTTPVEPASTETVTVTGRVLTVDGSPAVNDTIALFKSEIGSGIDSGGPGYTAVRTDGQGYFEATVESGFNYELAYYQLADANLSTTALEIPNNDTAFPVDGVPDVYSLGNYNVTTDRNVGTYSLPQAHLVQIRALVGSDPLPNATIDVFSEPAQIEANAGFVGTAVTENGELQSIFKNTTGFELAGTVRLIVDSPNDSRYVETDRTERTLTITEPRSVILTLEENNPPTGSITVSNRTPAVGQTVTFNTFGVTDPNNDEITSINWSFTPSTGVDATGSRVTHTYLQAGEYTVRATISDEHGLNTTLKTNVSVEGPDSPPPLAGAPPTDPDTDGQYEDINGDGDVNLADVFALAFDVIPEVATRPELTVFFDFDGSGEVDLDDVFALAFS